MKRFIVIIILLLLSTSPLYGQDSRPALGINLEDYDYPYPAEYFSFESQQQSMKMAFMYKEAGDPNGRTILLFHGKNFNGAYFGEVMQALLEEGFNVLAPDQIGFGKSTFITTPSSSWHRIPRRWPIPWESIEPSFWVTLWAACWPHASR